MNTTEQHGQGKHKNKRLLSVFFAAAVFVRMEDEPDQSDAATPADGNPGPEEAPNHNPQAAPEVVFADSEDGPDDDYDANNDPLVCSQIF